MRHEAAIARQSSFSKDVALGTAVFAVCAALVVGLGLWTHYVSATFLIIGVAVLAWHSDNMVGTAI